MRALVLAVVALVAAMGCDGSRRAARPNAAPPATLGRTAETPPSRTGLDVLRPSNAGRLERLKVDTDAAHDVRFVRDGTLVVTWSHDIELVAPDGTVRARVPYAERLAGRDWHDKPAWRGSDPDEQNVEIAVLAEGDHGRCIDVYGTDGVKHSRVDAPGASVIDHVSRGRLAFGVKHDKVQVWDRAARALVGEVDVSRAHAWSSDGGVVATARDGHEVDVVDFRTSPSAKGPTKTSFAWEGEPELPEAQPSADAVSIAPDGTTVAALGGDNVTVFDVQSRRRAVHASVGLFEDGGWGRPGTLALRAIDQLWLVDRANPKLVEKKAPPPIRCGASKCDAKAITWQDVRWGSDGAPTLLGRAYPNVVVWPVGGEARSRSLDAAAFHRSQLFAGARHIVGLDGGDWQIVRAAEAAGAPWPVLLSGHADGIASSRHGPRLATRFLGAWRLYDAEAAREIARSPEPTFEIARGRTVARSELGDDLLEVLLRSYPFDGTLTRWSVAARAGRYAVRDDTYRRGAIDVLDLRSGEILWSGVDANGAGDFTLDPKGDRVAAIDGTTPSRVKVWNKGRAPVFSPTATTIADVAFAGPHVVATTHASTMGWDGTNPPWVTKCTADRDVRVLVGDGGARVTVGFGDKYCVLDANTGAIVARIDLGRDDELGPYASPDGNELFVYAKGRVRRWQVSDGRELPPVSLVRSAGGRRALVYAPNGTDIVAIDAAGFVVTFDRASGRESSRFPARGATALDVSSTGLVVALAADGAGALYDRQGQPLTTFACPRAADAWFASDGRAVFCRRGTEEVDDVFVVPR